MGRWDENDQARGALGRKSKSKRWTMGKDRPVEGCTQRDVDFWTITIIITTASLASAYPKLRHHHRHPASRSLQHRIRRLPHLDISHHSHLPHLTATHLSPTHTRTTTSQSSTTIQRKKQSTQETERKQILTHLSPSLEMAVDRYKHFRWTPRTAWITVAYVCIVPSIMGYFAYTTDVS